MDRPDASSFRTTWGPWIEGDGATFRLWAPKLDALTLRLEGEDRAMRAAGDGWFEARVDGARAGARYNFVLPDGAVIPDPAARAQDGVDGPSILVDPAAHEWRHPPSDRPWAEAAIVEIHPGTFTPDGTLGAAAQRLDHLVHMGFTAVELMPVATFAGERGWGYDGVLPYAPHRAYGGPEGLKTFVDAAHERGLMVLLDVVYNHFGPDGNFLNLYANFFHDDRETPWGAAIAYDHLPVRRFFIDNALYWLTEYRIDGLRLDAIDYVRDPGSEPEILVEIAQVIRAALPDRQIHLTTEDNRNITALHERGEDGCLRLYTAEWNDDMHNAAHVIATGESEGYYQNFATDPFRQFARSLAEGFAYQGETAPETGEARGVPSAHLPPLAFVDFVQNHDQVGNRAFGERLIHLTSPRMLSALTTILCLSPHVPLFFMGEEWAEMRPFYFFTDFDGDLAEAVRNGRRSEFADFKAFQGEGHGVDEIPDPNDPATFEASKIDWSRAVEEEGKLAIEAYRHLLTLRQERIVPHLAGAGGNAGTIVHRDGGAMAIDWALDGATLCLRANLGEERATLPEARGDLLHASGDDAGAPMSAAFWIDRA